MACAGEATGGERKQVTISMSEVEFTRRRSLLLLPLGFTRIRRYGGWSNTKRKQCLKQFAGRVGEGDAPLAVGAADEVAVKKSQIGSPDDQEVVEIKVMTCKSCGASLIPHSVTSKPSWVAVRNSQHRPNLYQRR